MRVWICPYELHPRQPLNSHEYELQSRLGVLLKVEFEEGKVGYSDLHCPSEMNGLRLFDLMRLITGRELEHRFNLSIERAQVDSELRRVHQGSKGSQTELKNHYLITDLTSVDPLQLIVLESHGFDRFKIKMGRSLKRETAVLKRICETISSASLVRLDFNESLDKKQFHRWLRDAESWLVRKVEFIEDPFAYDSNSWSHMQNKYGVSLALDSSADPLQVDSGGFNYVIIKPAWQQWESIVNKFIDEEIQFVFTHAMDHPVGISAALIEAGRAKVKLGQRLVTCGLLPGKIYESNIFTESWEVEGPGLRGPGGKGVGFDSLLSDLSWTRLTGY